MIFDLLKKIFCFHKWEYWDAKLVCDSNGRLDGIIIENKYKKCKKCDVIDIMSTRVSEWGKYRRKWVSHYHLPKNSKIVELKVHRTGDISKQEIREGKLEDLLSNYES